MQSNLYAIRKANNESQKDLAELLGLSTDTYRLKELDTYQFKLEEMFDIAKHYGMTLDDIFLPRNYTKR